MTIPRRRTERETALARIESWFTGRGWRPFEAQRRTWNDYLAGRSGLVHAPTGTGKTYAAWLGPVAEALAGAEREQPPADGPRVVWITPLRALAHDLVAGLRRPLDELGLDWRVEARTGDTSQATRARQRRAPPEALVTTPESVTLLVSRPDAEATFRSLRAVVVDEWHELLGSKRGVQTELALARLRALAPGLRTWGLSATLGNLEQARDVLLGAGAPDGSLVRGDVSSQVELETVFPAEVERFPWSGHMGLRLLPEVLAIIEASRSVLVFTNTRSQAELWFRSIAEALPDELSRIGLHHGSIDVQTRREVEAGLASGELRCVVCTSSLDLGVDFPHVDQVVQIGSPRGIGRLLQRAGRAGHRPGEPSRIHGVPAHAFELVEYAAARDALAAGEVEPRAPRVGSLDVLAQHVVTCAAAGPVDPAALLAEVRTTHAYAGLDDETWGWVLDFAARGGRTLAAYPQFQRLVRREGRWHVADERAARLHRANIGTIVGDVVLDVRFRNGRSLGTVEETFVARLRAGDAFLFAGRMLELVRLEPTHAVVRAARGVRGVVPRWHGGRMPLSSQLAARVRGRLGAAAAGRYDGDEMEAARPVLELQRACSRIPVPGELLVERVRVDGTHLVYLYPFEGRLVHEGLAALLGYRLTRRRPLTVIATVNDYGIELSSGETLDVGAHALADLLDESSLLDELLECVNTSGLARRHFREVARIAGLTSTGWRGRRGAARALQTSSELLFDVFERYDPDNLLLDQARRETLEQQLEVSRLRDALARMRRARVTVVDAERLTPLAYPLWAESLRAQQTTTERWEQRVRRMAVRLERGAP